MKPFLICKPWTFSWILNVDAMVRKVIWLCVLSQSTVVLCIVGMDEVFQHHAHTFEKSDLNFHF